MNIRRKTKYNILKTSFLESKTILFFPHFYFSLSCVTSCAILQNHVWPTDSYIYNSKKKQL